MENTSWIWFEKKFYTILQTHQPSWLTSPIIGFGVGIKLESLQRPFLTFCSTTFYVLFRFQVFILLWYFVWVCMYLKVGMTHFYGLDHLYASCQVSSCRQVKSGGEGLGFCTHKKNCPDLYKKKKNSIRFAKKCLLPY